MYKKKKRFVVGVCKIQTLSPRCLMMPLQVLEAVRIKSCLTHQFPLFLFIPTSVISADSAVKNQPASAGDAGDTGSTPGSGRSPGGGNCNPVQYSCLENSMYRGAWWAAVQGHKRIGHD